MDEILLIDDRVSCWEDISHLMDAYTNSSYCSVELNKHKRLRKYVYGNSPLPSNEVININLFINTFSNSTSDNINLLKFILSLPLDPEIDYLFPKDSKNSRNHSDSPTLSKNSVLNYVNSTYSNPTTQNKNRYYIPPRFFSSYLKLLISLDIFDKLAFSDVFANLVFSIIDKRIDVESFCLCHNYTFRSSNSNLNSNARFFSAYLDCVFNILSKSQHSTSIADFMSKNMILVTENEIRTWFSGGNKDSKTASEFSSESSKHKHLHNSSIVKDIFENHKSPNCKFLDTFLLNIILNFFKLGLTFNFTGSEKLTSILTIYGSPSLLLNFSNLLLMVHKKSLCSSNPLILLEALNIKSIIVKTHTKMPGFYSSTTMNLFIQDWIPFLERNLDFSGIKTIFKHIPLSFNVIPNKKIFPSNKKTLFPVKIEPVDYTSLKNFFISYLYYNSISIPAVSQYYSLILSFLKSYIPWSLLTSVVISSCFNNRSDFTNRFYHYKMFKNLYQSLRIETNIKNKPPKLSKSQSAFKKQLSNLMEYTIPLNQEYNNSFYLYKNVKFLQVHGENHHSIAFSKIGYYMVINILNEAYISTVPGIKPLFNQIANDDVLKFTLEVLISHSILKNDSLLYNIYYIFLSKIVFQSQESKQSDEIKSLIKLNNTFIDLTSLQKPDLIQVSSIFAGIFDKLNMKDMKLNFLLAMNKSLFEKFQYNKNINLEHKTQKIFIPMFVNPYTINILIDVFLYRKSYFFYHLIVLEKIKNSDSFLELFSDSQTSKHCETAKTGLTVSYVIYNMDDKNRIVPDVNFYNLAKQYSIVYFLFERLLKMHNRGNHIIDPGIFNGLNAVLFDTLGFHNQVTIDQILDVTDSIIIISKKLYLRSTLIKYHNYGELNDTIIKHPNIMNSNNNSKNKKPEPDPSGTYNPILNMSNYLLNTNVINSIIEALCRKKDIRISPYEIVYFALVYLPEITSFRPSTLTKKILLRYINSMNLNDPNLLPLIHNFFNPPI
ncbi:hypothetical protein AYI68_g8320 [Smittium mucronatum]|uniref:Uncharacterized protein n=1 Tax=Smittium mucronatum TaxID=133383 RepID=A0A1R0GL84_9FUNG|nr:hypothetical protein AYI68_g8320 [Smittium mucronatum]